MLEDFAFICIVGESGRETEREREREKKDERDLSDRKLGPRARASRMARKNDGSYEDASS